MKKIYLVLFLFLSISLNALEKSPYLNTNAQLVKISDLKNIMDDDKVKVQGNIIKKIKKETYLFQDETSAIKIEIDDDINYKLENVNKDTLIEIYGEYEKNGKKSKIEVKDIKIIK